MLESFSKLINVGTKHPLQVLCFLDMDTYLKQNWFELLKAYKVDLQLTQNLWDELVQHYSEKHRAYHNLQHLYDIFIKLEKQKAAIHDLPAIHFSIWYHDIIYQSLGKRNEEKSAILCSKRLQELGFGSDFKEKVSKLIYSTKTHRIETWTTEAAQEDNAYLLDLDLSILGTDAKTYQNYTRQIRQEYRLVPNFLYKRGRKKVIQHFLKMDRIFKTETFYEEYERIARGNLEWELGSF